jgi:hypothetical protein
MSKRDFTKGAKPQDMRFSATFSTEGNGEDTKTWKITIKARDKGSIDHWYFGTVYHDLDSMKWRKSKVAVDWCHSSDLLGYVNKHEIREDGLYLSGVLKPKDDDSQCSQVIHYLESEIPLEASIDFADEYTIEVLTKGQKATVNGMEVEGTEEGVVIIRDWFLRRIAICPSGADGETSTEKEWTGKDRVPIVPSLFSKDDTEQDVFSYVITGDELDAYNLTPEEREDKTSLFGGSITTDKDGNITEVEAGICSKEELLELHAKAMEQQEEQDDQTTVEAEGEEADSVDAEGKPVDAEEEEADTVDAEDGCKDCEEKEAKLTALAEKLSERDTKIAEYTATVEQLTKDVEAVKAQFVTKETDLREQLAQAINGDSKPLGIDGNGKGAEPTTWSEAVTKLGYAKARAKYPELRTKTIK